MNNIFIGLMTGTSVDSLDLAAVKCIENNLEVIGTANFDIPSDLKRKIKNNVFSKEIDQSSLQDLDNTMALFFAENIKSFINSLSLNEKQIVAIGSHGQTIKHEPESAIPFSLQIGNPQVISNKLEIKTVGNFRQDDIDAGGQGAPLSPIFHQEVFQNENERRVIVNIGGITNLSILGTSKIIGFDSGPGNCLLDAWIAENKKVNFDIGGNWAKSGKVSNDLLNVFLKDNYFSSSYPKSTGPDYFSLEWIKNSLDQLDYPVEPKDVQRTLTELTVITLYDSLKKINEETNAIYFCGGGIHNDFLMSRMSAQFNKKLLTTSDLGINPDFLEAICFAWLAHKRINNTRFNMGEITGSKGKVYLGRIYEPFK